MVLGRSTFAKFMVIPHYIYLVLKVPTPIIVLALWGDIKSSYNYEKETQLLATALD